MAYSINNWTKLAEQGFYFIGDSAYELKSFLFTPYDNVLHGTPEDNYNFFHSSSRISVECAFGEIDLRWGIFWSPLRFSLKHNCNVIDAAMNLHNFIVDFREETRDTSPTDDIEHDLFDDNCRFFCLSTLILMVVVCTGEKKMHGWIVVEILLMEEVHENKKLSLKTAVQTLETLFAMTLIKGG